ncbi:MAG: DMT family transporter [Oscillospiraceae bacterium]|nr:DMT family transporter [Oscillospiraceae bacterium]
MNRAKGKLPGAMGIFGTIGLLVRFIPLPSSIIALCRAVLGLGFLILAVIGIVHTGIAYTLYLGALEKLSAKAIGVLCYLDPVLAVALSALILKEPMSPLHILGTVLVLGSALYSELPKKEHLNRCSFSLTRFNQAGRQSQFQPCRPRYHSCWALHHHPYPRPQIRKALSHPYPSPQCSWWGQRRYPRWGQPQRPGYPQSHPGLCFPRLLLWWLCHPGRRRRSGSAAQLLPQ